jgi:NAD(P)-dependent dehydrogenase (short-subunit alcohol dehydrogenase family)
MIEGGGGGIVNMASVAGVVGLRSGAAYESLDALRARQPMGRLGQPEVIAEAVLYLAPDTAAFITGSVLTIDGGLRAA